MFVHISKFSCKTKKYKMVPVILQEKYLRNLVLKNGVFTELMLNSLLYHCHDYFNLISFSA